MNLRIETLRNNWHFMRVLRLSLGLFIAYQAVKTQDAFSGLMAAFFLFQAISNTGCCGAQACSSASFNTKEPKAEALIYEEIKSDKAEPR